MDDKTMNEEFKLFILNETEIEMIVKGLKKLQQMDFAGDVMDMMMETLLKPPKDATPEMVQAYEKTKLEQIEKKKVEKEKHQKKVGRIEVLKAKIIIMQEMRREKELEFELRKPERQITG